MCKAWETTGECSRGDNCKFAHSYAGYFEVKPQDIHHEVKGAFSTEPPFATFQDRLAGGEDALGKTLDLNTECPVYVDLGYCPYGWRCRFLGGHIRKAQDDGATSNTRMGEWELSCKTEPSDVEEGKNGEINWPRHELISDLRNNRFAWRFSTDYLHHIEPHKEFVLAKPKGEFHRGKKSKPVEMDEESAMNAGGEEDAMNGAAEEAAANGGKATNGEQKGHVPGEAEAMDVPLRAEEKRRLNWDNGLYLAPLTTVGNLVGDPVISI